MTHRCHKGGWICGPECEERKRLVPAWQRKLMTDACETQEVLTADDLDDLERTIYAEAKGND